MPKSCATTVCGLMRHARSRGESCTLSASCGRRGHATKGDRDSRCMVLSRRSGERRRSYRSRAGRGSARRSPSRLRLRIVSWRKRSEDSSVACRPRWNGCAPHLLLGHARHPPSSNTPGKARSTRGKVQSERDQVQRSSGRSDRRGCPLRRTGSPGRPQNSCLPAVPSVSARCAASRVR